MFTFARNQGKQIFATTHSLEMLKVFSEVGMRTENEPLAGCIEMAINYRKSKVVAIPYKMGTLEYCLERSKAVRGEVRI
jgi:hypothetical protein